MPEEDRYQHYEVLKRPDGGLWELGHGAMGVTYKAYDTNLRCTVALKVINAVYLENETARQRFLCEARAAAALRHQNVASVFHLGTDHGTYFYAMEFVDGQTVDEYLKQKGKLTPLEALDIAFQVARALAAAARQQLVHRDLKPANLMLVDQDGEKVVKVIDFGLVKSAKREEEGSAPLTVAFFCSGNGRGPGAQRAAPGLATAYRFGNDRGPNHPGERIFERAQPAGNPAGARAVVRSRGRRRVATTGTRGRPRAA
jgi:serine/threonine protein kinase